MTSLRIYLAIILSFLAVAFSFPSAHAEGGGAAQFRLVSWNIEWFPGKKRFPTPEEAAAHAALVQGALGKINPDVLLAQEVGDWQSFAELSDAVPNLRPVVVSAFTSDDTGEYWSQQLAIASRLPVFAAWSERWAVGEAVAPSRGFSAAAIQVPGTSKVVLIYNVHLKSNRSSTDEEAQINFDMRDESVEQLIAHARRMETEVFLDRVVGVVVAGDFNTDHDGRFGDNAVALMEKAGFRNTWRQTPRQERLTWRGNDRFEPTTFDYIFVRGLESTEAKLIPIPEGLSDHWPLEATITLPTPAL